MRFPKFPFQLPTKDGLKMHILLRLFLLKRKITGFMARLRGEKE